MAGGDIRDGASPEVGFPNPLQAKFTLYIVKINYS
jgi:hypothetical protein